MGGGGRERKRQKDRERERERADIQCPWPVQAGVAVVGVSGAAAILRLGLRIYEARDGAAGGAPPKTLWEEADDLRCVRLPAFGGPSRTAVC